MRGLFFVGETGVEVPEVFSILNVYIRFQAFIYGSGKMT